MLPIPTVAFILVAAAIAIAVGLALVLTDVVECAIAPTGPIECHPNRTDTPIVSISNIAQTVQVHCSIAAAHLANGVDSSIAVVGIVVSTSIQGPKAITMAIAAPIDIKTAINSTIVLLLALLLLLLLLSTHLHVLYTLLLLTLLLMWTITNHILSIVGTVVASKHEVSRHIHGAVPYAQSSSHCIAEVHTLILSLRHLVTIPIYCLPIESLPIE